MRKSQIHKVETVTCSNEQYLTAFKYYAQRIQLIQLHFKKVRDVVDR